MAKAVLALFAIAAVAALLITYQEPNRLTVLASVASVAAVVITGAEIYWKSRNEGKKQ